MSAGQPQGIARRVRRGLGALLALALASLACLPLAASPDPPARPQTITVVMDDNYPPYVFRDDKGALQGYLPDVWRLWQRRTGVAVALVATDWGKAKEQMAAGQADVIDTIFRTPEREAVYDFTPPYADLPVPVFAHRTIGGIADLATLRGFLVGAKEGDACVDVLNAGGVTTLRLFPSYDAVARAAASGEIKVFCLDEPPALYLLYRYGIDREFNRAFTLYTGQFHRAVHRGNVRLLTLVNEGFAAIRPSETRSLQRKWMGAPLNLRPLGLWALAVVLAATLAGLLLAAWNVTLRRKVQAQSATLRESEERYRQLFDMLSDPLFLIDRESGRILEANAAAVAHYGYSREQLLAMRNVAVSAEPDQTREATVTQATDTAVRLHRRSDGTVFPVEIRATHFEWHGRRVHLAAIRDITERRRAEEERLEMQRQLLHTQKLESLGVLAGGVAHDFNNLLMAMLGNLDLALCDLPDGSPARGSVAEAMAAAQRAADLTRQMLAYSGKGRFAVEAVDLSALVEANAQLFRVTIPRNVELRLDLGRGLPAVEADAGQVQQVVMNLLTNAAEAIGPVAGLVSLRTSVQTCSAADLSQSRLPVRPEPGRFVAVEVTDTGCGMDDEIRQRLFEPFFTTKFTGRGLGMATVLGIVRGHKGAITVDSRAGAGTTVRVLFPAGDTTTGDGRPTAPARPDNAATPDATPRQTVLVVDDEESVRNIGRRMVERCGYLALTAVDGQDAIDVFRQHADRIDVVLLDLSMPHLDGLAAFAELRRLRPDVRVILSSGYGETEATAHFAGQGLAGFLQKPYKLASLHTVLTRVLAPPAA